MITVVFFFVFTTFALRDHDILPTSKHTNLAAATHANGLKAIGSSTDGRSVVLNAKLHSVIAVTQIIRESKRFSQTLLFSSIR